MNEPNDLVDDSAYGHLQLINVSPPPQYDTINEKKPK